MNPAEKYREFFENLYKKYNTREYIKTDPIIFPHNTDGNTEFIAFTASAFAYGNVKAMKRFLSDYFSTIASEPRNLSLKEHTLKYRFQNSGDITAYSEAMRNIYRDYGSLENLFWAFNHGGGVYGAAEKAFAFIHTTYLPKPVSGGLNFLFALPGRSASKRLTMFLRWMVRDDEVDLGLWKRFGKNELAIPLDTHMQRLCANLGVIGRADKGAGAARKVQAFFKELSPEDPAKYDFALTRLGIAKGCVYEISDACGLCTDKQLCVFHQTAPKHTSNP
jgi:uncharacterized protein (TIGR02757 family)